VQSGRISNEKKARGLIELQNARERVVKEISHSLEEERRLFLRGADEDCENSIIFDFECEDGEIYAGGGCENCEKDSCEYFVALSDLPEIEWECKEKNSTLWKLTALGLECDGDALVIKHCHTGFNVPLDPGEGYCACTDFLDNFNFTMDDKDECKPDTVEILDCVDGTPVKGKNCDVCGSTESCIETEPLLDSFLGQTLLSCDTTLVGVAVSCDPNDNFEYTYCNTQSKISTSLVPDIACKCDPIANCEEGNLMEYGCDPDTNLVVRGTSCTECNALDSCQNIEEVALNQVLEPYLSCDTSPVGIAYSCSEDQGLILTLCDLFNLQIPVQTDEELGCSCADKDSLLPFDLSSLPSLKSQILSSSFAVQGISLQSAQAHLSSFISAIENILGIQAQVDIDFSEETQDQSFSNRPRNNRHLLYNDDYDTIIIIKFQATITTLPQHLDAIVNTITNLNSQTILSALRDADSDFFSQPNIVIVDINSQGVTVIDVTPSDNNVNDEEDAKKDKKKSRNNTIIIIVIVLICAIILLSAAFFVVYRCCFSSSATKSINNKTHSPIIEEAKPIRDQNYNNEGGI